MAEPLIEIVRRVQTADATIQRQGIVDLVANSGDGYNARYTNYIARQPDYKSQTPGWLAMWSYLPAVGATVTFRCIVDDDSDNIRWEDMLNRQFVIVDAATKWTKYQLYKVNSSVSNVYVPKNTAPDPDIPAYRYRQFTALCMETYGPAIAFGEAITVKTPDFFKRSPGVAAYTMSTPTTFVVSAEVAGHRLTLDPDDPSLRNGFMYWQVEQADDALGTNATYFVYSQGGLPALVDVDPGVQKFYRIRSVSVLGDYSGWSAYTSAVYNTVPAPATWATHTYAPDGHLVTWSHPLAASVDYFILYRNTSASASGATVIGTVGRDDTSYLIAYASGGDYFGIKAVGYSGADAGITWSANYPAIPGAVTPTAAMVKLGGYVVSWAAASNYPIGYEVQGAPTAAAAARLRFGLAPPATPPQFRLPTLTISGCGPLVMAAPARGAAG